jgi:hypothetical protein
MHSEFRTEPNLRQLKVSESHIQGGPGYATAGPSYVAGGFLKDGYRNVPPGGGGISGESGGTG